jgi:hypothetical protein
LNLNKLISAKISGNGGTGETINGAFYVRELDLSIDKKL